MRRLALFLVLTALSAEGAAPEQRADIAADLSSVEANGDTVLTGNARLTDAGILLTADEIRFSQKTQIAVATGHVILTRIGDRLLADTLTFNRTNGIFTAKHLRVGRFPYYIEGESAEGNQSEVVVHNATVTYRELSKTQPTIHARTLTFSKDHYLRLAGASVGIGSHHPIPVSKVGQDLTHQSTFSQTTLDGGYRSTLGAYADVGLHMPVFTGASIGPDIGVYTARGVMLGPLADYDITSGDDTAVGYLKSGYIHDFGVRDPDVLNQPVPANRAYVEWHHNQEVNPDLTITGDINWSTDSEVIRDFHSKVFVPVQEPDNFLEAVYTGSDYLASVFTRFQPDAYYPVQERLPELRFDLLPTLVGGGIYVRLNTGLVHLEEHPPDGGARLATDRFDTFFGVTRPFSYKGIFDFTPVAGARYTEYWNTFGAEGNGTDRALGELGFDADIKMSAVFNYENPLWHIDGIRHLFTPILSYRYIPNGDKDSAFIPPIDRSTFTNYLPILELGDMRAVDQLQAENVVRVGFNNTLQTRDPTYGSRDVLSLKLEEDFRFERTAIQSDFSDIHADVIATPARWLELRIEDTVSPERAAQRAVDADITVREGELWMARIGLGYLSDKYGVFNVPGLGYYPIVGVDTFHYELRRRLNEVYEVFVRGDYDARDHIFVDQYYGAVQRISNTWLVGYAVVFSQGPNNGQGHFGFEVSVNLVRF